VQTAPGTAQVDTKHSTPRVEIFLGLPDLRPHYVAAARELGSPIMVSASALSKNWTSSMREADHPHPGFRVPPPGRLHGIRCALDSMGYTAMKKWGGYVVTPEAYIELAAAHEWEFWASQDLCCEPDVALDEELVCARICETAWRYDRLCELADGRGIKRPLKVLQGWGWHHYLICAEALTLAPATRSSGSARCAGDHAPVQTACSPSSTDSTVNCRKASRSTSSASSRPRSRSWLRTQGWRPSTVRRGEWACAATTQRGERMRSASNT